MADTLYKPGTIADYSGQYEIVGQRGGNKGGYERTVTKGEPFPPTPEAGLKFKLTDPTNNGAGKPKK